MTRRDHGDASTHGVVLVDKPAGPTSHEVVQFVRFALRAPVGHFGTLDPAATGLLVLGVGAATKLAPFASAEHKRYRAQFVLGRSTATGDGEGETIERSECAPADTARAVAELRKMVGPLQLPPPAFSAVHVAGVRAHVLARADAAPALPERPMVVHAVEEITSDADTIAATLSVSKGTYLRSIAVELGARVGVPSHLGGLRRLQCGALRLDDPLTVGPLRCEALSPAPTGKPRFRLRIEGTCPSRDAQATALRSRVAPPWRALGCPHVELGRPADAALLTRLAHGQTLPAAALEGRVSRETAGLVALLRRDPPALLLAEVDRAAETVRPIRRILFTMPAGSDRATHAEDDPRERRSPQECS